MPVENISQTDLGGGAPEGAEPDIFADAGGDVGDAGDAGDTGDAGDAGDAGDGAVEGEGDEGAAEGDEGTADGEGEGDEGAADGEGEGEGEGDGEDDAGKTPEQIAAEKAAADAAAAAKKPLTEEEKKVESALKEAYRDNPKIRQFLKENPEVRFEFFKASQLNKIYPTIQEAEKAKSWAMELLNIDKLYFGQGDESKRGFQKKLWEEALDQNGQSTGHYEKLQEMFTTDTLTNLEAVLTQNPTLAEKVAAGFKPNQAATSIEVVRRLMSAALGRPIGGAAKQSGDNFSLPAEATANMTPRERQLAEENARYKGAIEAANKTNAEQVESNFNSQTFTKFWDAVKPEIDKRAPNGVKGNQFYEQSFANAVLKEVHKQLRQDEFFDSQLEAASRAGDRGPEHIAEIAGMLEQRARTLIPTIARQIAAKAQAKVAAAGAVKAANGSSQRTTRTRGTERPRREPNLGGTPGRLAKPGVGASKTPGRQAGMKSSGDYNRDADRILGIED